MNLVLLGKDVLLNIFALLDYKDIIRISTCCKIIHELICSNDRLWLSLTNEYFHVSYSFTSLKERAQRVSNPEEFGERFSSWRNYFLFKVKQRHQAKLQVFYRNMVLTNNGLTCTNFTKTRMHIPVHSTLILDEGVYYWTVKVSTKKPETYGIGQIFLGVSVAMPDQSNHKISYLGYSPTGWSLCPYSKQVLHGGKFASYAYTGKLLQNDVVGIFVDMDNRTLEYSVNGKWFGVAFSNLSEKLSPCASVMLDEETVSYDFTAPFPKDRTPSKM